MKHTEHCLEIISIVNNIYDKNVNSYIILELKYLNDI